MTDTNALPRALPGRAREAYALLTMTAMMWAGNAIAARMAVGEISPLLMTVLRWLIACATLAVVARRQVMEEWRLIVPAWPLVLALGAFGFTAFNALYYAAGAYTTAVNLTIIQGSVPVVVLIGSFLIYGSPIRPLQVVGVLATLTGVAVAASHGDFEVLRAFAFNLGDVFVLVASLLYAGFTLALPLRPKVSGLVFFSAMAGVACLTAIPLAVAEIASGRAIWPTTPKAIAVVLFVSWCPSLLSQLSYMRGVELIGPNRAGIFVNLVPVFGALMAVVILGEPFRPADALALTLVIGGIYVAERLGRP